MDVLGAFDSWLEGVENQMKEECDPGKIASACREATEEIRKEIIQGWGPYRWQSTDAATQYNQSVSESGSKGKGWSVSVLTDSYVDSGAFFPATLNWDYFGRNPGVTPDPQEWVLEYLMEDGIIGLPPIGVLTGWKNHHFKSTSPGLEAYFDASGIWQTFESRVKSKI